MGPRTADDQDCFSKFIVERALKRSPLKPEGMRAPTSSRQITEVNLLLTC